MLLFHAAAEFSPHLPDDQPDDPDGDIAYALKDIRQWPCGVPSCPHTQSYQHTHTHHTWAQQHTPIYP